MPGLRMPRTAAPMTRTQHQGVRARDESTHPSGSRWRTASPCRRANADSFVRLSVMPRGMNSSRQMRKKTCNTISDAERLVRAHLAIPPVLLRPNQVRRRCGVVMRTVAFGQVRESRARPTAYCPRSPKAWGEIESSPTPAEFPLRWFPRPGQRLRHLSSQPPVEWLGTDVGIFEVDHDQLRLGRSSRETYAVNVGLRA